SPQHRTRHRTDAARHHARPDHLLLRSLGQSQRSLRRRLQLLSRQPKPDMDSGPDRQERLLLPEGAERPVPPCRDLIRNQLIARRDLALLDCRLLLASTTKLRTRTPSAASCATWEKHGLTQADEVIESRWPTSDSG